MMHSKWLEAVPFSLRDMFFEGRSAYRRCIMLPDYVAINTITYRNHI